MFLKIKYIGIMIVGLGSVSLLENTSFADTHTISQKNKQLSRAKLNVRLGDSIVFKNEEEKEIHNVYSVSAENKLDLKTQQPGTSTTVVVEPGKFKPGKMLIECAIHPEMKLEVTITR